MKRVVLGVTGRTGRHVVMQALAAGHRVTAVARRLAARTISPDRLTVVRGDVLEPDTLSLPMAG